MGEVTKGLAATPDDVKANIDAASIRRAPAAGTRDSAGSAFLTDRPKRNRPGCLTTTVILELKRLAHRRRAGAEMALLAQRDSPSTASRCGGSADLVAVTLVGRRTGCWQLRGGEVGAGRAGEGKAAEAFANTLAENRKYGDGA